MSFPWHIVVIVAVLILWVITLAVLVSKRRESHKLRRRLAELRSMILSEEQDLGRVEEKEHYMGTLTLPSGARVPILIWYTPRLSFYGSIAPKTIGELVRPIKPRWRAPRPKFRERAAPEIGEPMKPLGPRFSLDDLIREVYSARAPKYPFKERVPAIPKERWNELRVKLRELMNSRPRLS